eukprot:7042599-Lingulodinium_polyedra.AAC.1
MCAQCGQGVPSSRSATEVVNPTKGRENPTGNGQPQLRAGPHSFALQVTVLAHTLQAGCADTRNAVRNPGQCM